jgi:hypothetical protein
MRLRDPRYNAASRLRSKGIITICKLQIKVLVAIDGGVS